MSFTMLPGSNVQNASDRKQGPTDFSLRLKLIAGSILSFIVLSLPVHSQAGVIAYAVTNVGVVGNASVNLAFGMDFNTTTNVLVTSLGVFDSGANGYAGTLKAELWRRDSGGSAGTKLADLTFTSGNPGTLGSGVGSRFLSVSSATLYPGFTGELYPGFLGTIVAHGFSASDPWYNASSGADKQWVLNTGGGLVSFVGSGRTGTAGSYPASPDSGGGVDPYGAGTFEFEDNSPAALGTNQFLVYQHPVAFNTTGNPGNRSANVALGMDFLVNTNTYLHQLGVYDSGSLGIAGTLHVRLYSWAVSGSTTNSILLATNDFTTANAGSLYGGGRFSPVDTNNFVNGFTGKLFAGTNYSIVADGWNSNDLWADDANQGTGPWTKNSGGGILTFLNTGRFSLTTGGFPESLDTYSRNDPYAAGSLILGPLAVNEVPEPTSLLLECMALLVLGKA